MKRPTISGLSRIILLAVMLLFFSALFFPMWRIELWAPQYPEGLVLQLYANRIGGDVDIINGLNHYIGMKTLHTENFPEFKFLPYIVGVFGLFALAAGLIGKRKMLYGLFVSFATFGILAAVDFYRWNYQYGHDLDPNAAIRVPGMAYQPPLIGYKQLLNFGAYSIPDIGGWLLIAAGLLLFGAILKETRLFGRLKKTIPVTVMVLMLFGLSSCGSHEPIPIKLNVDNCDFCKMTISDSKCCAFHTNS
jgi:copper chaperone NosL